MAIPLYRNVIQKEDGKKLKCKNLSTETQQMCNTKHFFLPVITGATGIVSKGPDIYIYINSRREAPREGKPVVVVVVMMMMVNKLIILGFHVSGLEFLFKMFNWEQKQLHSS
jgi:hypothetical protein